MNHVRFNCNCDECRAYILKLLQASNYADAFKMKGEKEMKETTETILAEREKTHGQFRGQALIAQSLKNVMRITRNWHNLTVSQKEALEMDAHKTARILNGDPSYEDSWADKAGYATLIVREIQEGKLGPF